MCRRCFFIFVIGFVLIAELSCIEHIHREDVQQIFKEGIEILKKAEIYAQRIDWYLSGDDGEDSLISRLKSDLDALS